MNSLPFVIAPTLPAVLPMHGPLVVVPPLSVPKLMGKLAVASTRPEGDAAESRPDRDAGVEFRAWHSAYRRKALAGLGANDDRFHVAGEPLVGEPVGRIGRDQGARGQEPEAGKGYGGAEPEFNSVAFHGQDSGMEMPACQLMRHNKVSSEEGRIPLHLNGENP